MSNIIKEEVMDMINSLESMQCEQPFSHGQKEVYEYIPKIIRILSLQIPTKPNVIDLGMFYSYKCKNCGSSLRNRDKYCCDCGKKVDWRELK